MCSLLHQYKKQWEWRSWDKVTSFLPNINNSLVYDLGCAHGDHSLWLSEMGAEVIGIDRDEELLKFAIQRNIPNAQFHLSDLSKVQFLNLPKADGVWTSFVPAYFTDFASILESWKAILKPRGWIAVTEMSGLFNHYPIPEEYETLLKEFYRDSFNKKNYDFESGEKLKFYLESSGFKIKDSLHLEDKELSFQGPAIKEVVTAWENRLERMGGLKKFLGNKYNSFRNEFISSIEDKNHSTNCKVYFHIATIK